MSTLTEAASIDKVSFDATQIQKMLPHKFPFLLLDKAFNIMPGKSGNGIKLYTINEWFFQGHFPGEPIVPGVLLVESLAQLAAIIYLSESLIKSGSDHSQDLSDLASYVGYIVKVNVKFMSPVRPGDQLDMSVNVVRKIGNLSMVKVKGVVGSVTVVDGEISVSEKKGS